MSTLDQIASPATTNAWLMRYYFARAGFSVFWVVLVSTLGQAQPLVGVILLVAYPLWDALANWVDAARSGGLGRNRSHAINVAVSLLTTLAVLVALQMGLPAVLAVFGAWAILSGLSQLVTALGRWKSYGAQWAMVLSGAQSALAGGFFVMQAQGPVPAVIPIIAGYAGFGAVYFLVSGVALVLAARRKRG